MESIWQYDAKLPGFATLQKPIKTDVLIIGGGMAGLLCARKLQDASVDYILCESNTISGGITKNTTAKLTIQHGLCYHKLIKAFGTETAQLYLQANQAALSKFHDLCPKLDCGYSRQTSWVYTQDAPIKLERELRALDNLGFPALFRSDLPLPLATAGAVGFPDQAQFHPLKFLSALTVDLRIFENTPIRELSPGKAVTDNGAITANAIIVATHFPLLKFRGSYYLKQYQHRSYCLALDNCQIPDGMYADDNSAGLSFRSHGNRLILGGGGHRTGKSGGGWAEPEAFARKHYPGAVIRARWAAQDCMTLDGIPYIGRYSPGTPDLYVATGFNKWGMTSSMVAAQILTDQICGIDNPYAEIFSPSRSILRPQLALNILESTANLLHFSKKRCPHLGCALKWNPAERTWDCPCHGSRFEENGKLIDNPATKDLNS